MSLPHRVLAPRLPRPASGLPLPSASWMLTSSLPAAREWFPQLADGCIATRTAGTLRSTVPVSSAATWRGLFPGRHRWLGLLRTYGVHGVIVGVLPGCGRCYEGF
jgi:hypothetical protein